MSAQQQCFKFWCLVNAQQQQCMQFVYCLMSPQLQCMRFWCLMIDQQECKQWFQQVLFSQSVKRKYCAASEQVRVRGEPSERLIPSLGVGMGPGGDKFFIIIIIIFILFAGPRAGPLYFDTQAPRRPRPTRKITPRLEVLLVKHQDLAVAGGC